VLSLDWNISDKYLTLFFINTLLDTTYIIKIKKAIKRYRIELPLKTLLSMDLISKLRDSKIYYNMIFQQKLTFHILKKINY
jgi:hypothetical protein